MLLNHPFHTDCSFNRTNGGDAIFCASNPIQSSCSSFCSNMPLNIDCRMYGSFRPPALSMKTTSFSQCPTSVYEAWCCLGDRIIFLPFNTQQITIMNLLFGNFGRLLLAMWPMFSPKSIAVAICLGISFSSTFEFHLHISTKTSQPTASESIEYYQNYSTAASPQTSPINLPPLHPVQWSVSNLFVIVLPPDTGLMLVVQIFSHVWCLLYVEHTIVSQPYPFVKLLQAEYHLVQADWCIALSTAHVRQIMILIIFSIIIVGHLRQWG